MEDLQGQILRVKINEIFERTFAHIAHVHQAHMHTLQIY